MINIETYARNFYTDENKQFVELLAKHVAAAIERIHTRREYLEAQQKLIEDQVKLERAQEMDEIKTRFISTATHEIRTLLTSIKGYTEILSGVLKDTGDEKSLEYFNVIARNIERLEHLTNDLLDLQRIESNRMSIDIVSTDLQKLIRDVQQEMLPLLAEKKQHLEVHSKTELASIPLDRLRLNEVLINLLSNASKFSPNNSTITLSILEKQSEIEFSIIDEGRGIEPENIEKLFKPFPDIVYSDVQRGTGLGLAICKGIIELHKGKIWAESQGRGKGTTVTFTIPKNS